MIYLQKPGFKARSTSKDAAKLMHPKAQTLRERVYSIVKSAGSAGITPDEAAATLGVSILSIRPRFSELALMGAIEDTMRRRVNASGRHAIVWRAI